MNRVKSKANNKGMTLVELLIGMALSLLLMGGAIGIFISSKQAYKTEDAMSRNQESGRFSITWLTNAIRTVGYVGCSNLEDMIPYVIANPPPARGYANTSAVLGYEGSDTSASNPSGTWTNPSSIAWVPGTDVITLSHSGDCGADLTGNMGVINANIQISNGAKCNFQAGDALLITDCQTADLFRASSVSESTGTITIAHASNVNTSNNLSRAYLEGSTVLRFHQSTYFIGRSLSGAPALYRTEFNGATEELIDNVANMQFVYGLDSNADGVVDQYRTADAVSDWKTAVSVRMSLLIQSEDGVVSVPQTITFDGSEANTGLDARLRSIFNATVGIRNRLP